MSADTSIDKPENCAGSLSKLAAFTQSPKGGNPAGVWIGDLLPSPDEMQKIAKEVGFSETAFIAPRTGTQRTIRYYSPEAEVAFCGHATIASGVALGEASGDGTYLLTTTVGEVPVTVTTHDGIKEASLVSVAPRYLPSSDDLLAKILSVLGWQADDIDKRIPPAKAYAGNWHFVLAAKTKARLDNLQYNFETLKSLMQENDLTTVQLIWQENDDVIHSRNPFPIGGVVEDPATGAAAAALGGYLREAKLVETPKTIAVRQGEIMGRPSLLNLTIPNTGGMIVSGTAVVLEE